MNVFNQHIDLINRLCEFNKVITFFAIGSITNDKLKPDSDIELVVEIDDNDPITYADKFYHLKFRLEEILKRQIDRTKVLFHDKTKPKKLICSGTSPS